MSRPPKPTAVEAARGLAERLRYNSFFQFVGVDYGHTTVYVYVGYLPRGKSHIPKKVGRFPVVVRRVDWQRLTRIHKN